MKTGFVLLLIALFVHSPFATAQSAGATAQSAGSFAATGAMITPRVDHTATLLNDGRVLITGGQVNDSGRRLITASAELYDPSNGTITAAGNMTMPRDGHTATLLPGGEVLITGGTSYDSAPALARAELYDPSTGAFTGAGNMTVPRTFHSATLLNTGQVLITGGVSNGVGALASAELYDPATGSFTPTGSMTANRNLPRATLLPDGKVLIVTGGDGNDDSAELYDPASGIFHATGWTGESIAANTANLLPNGKVLVTLATPECDYPGSAAWESDPATGAFGFAANMIRARCFQAGTSLSDGTVLITGSFCCGADTYSAEIFDPGSGTFSETGNLTAGRYHHTSTLLKDGTVLLAGGEGFPPPFGSVDPAGNSVLGTAELYIPRSVVFPPVLYSADGHGQGAIWKATTGEIASPENPAAGGEALSMYTTSLVDGGVLPPQVVVGGRLAEILYFGDAPGYPGYNQVNFVVPGGVAPGSAVPVRLIYLGRPSNAVTIGVH